MTSLDVDFLTLRNVTAYNPDGTEVANGSIAIIGLDGQLTFGNSLSTLEVSSIIVGTEIASSISTNNISVTSSINTGYGGITFNTGAGGTPYVLSTSYSNVSGEVELFFNNHQLATGASTDQHWGKSGTAIINSNQGAVSTANNLIVGNGLSVTTGGINITSDNSNAQAIFNAAPGGYMNLRSNGYFSLYSNNTGLNGQVITNFSSDNGNNYINNGGNVGIGTNTPNAKLHVIGNMSTVGNADITGYLSTHNTLNVYSGGATINGDTTNIINNITSGSNGGLRVVPLTSNSASGVTLTNYEGNSQWSLINNANNDGGNFSIYRYVNGANGVNYLQLSATNGLTVNNNAVITGNTSINGIVTVNNNIVITPSNPSTFGTVKVQLNNTNTTNDSGSSNLNIFRISTTATTCVNNGGGGDLALGTATNFSTIVVKNSGGATINGNFSTIGTSVFTNSLYANADIKLFNAGASRIATDSSNYNIYLEAANNGTIYLTNQAATTTYASFDNSNANINGVLNANSNIRVTSASENLTIAINASNGPFGSIEAFQTNNANTNKQPLILNGYGGNVGIGTTTPNATLNVNGTIAATGVITGLDVTASSDKRLKRDINTIENSLSTVLQMRGVSYYHKNTDNPSKKIGLIAQEVEEVLPEVIITDSSPDQFKSVSYGNIVGLLIEAIKELSAKVDILTSNKN